LPQAPTASPEIAVIFPLHDERDAVIPHLRSWTRGQTLARERYQMVLASNGERPDIDAAAERELSAHDVFAHFDVADESGLWQEGAAVAQTPWILFTEAHCLADPACLETLLDALAERPELEAAALGLDHERRGTRDDLIPRWFDAQLETSSHSDWTLLVAYGFAIRRDLFDALGGLDPRYGLFASWLLSARVHDAGRPADTIDRARVRHVHHETVAAHHPDSASHAIGECEARSESPPEFAERYFGFDAVWGNRLRFDPQLARRVAVVLGRMIAEPRPRAERALLARELAGWLPAALAGTRPELATQRALAAACTAAAQHLPLPRGSWRYALFLAAQDHTVHAARLEWVSSNRLVPPIEEPPVDAAEPVGIERLGSGAIVGLHGLERVEGRWFRWTTPVSLLRLDPGRARAITIDTGAVRGAPSAYLLGAAAGRRRIAPAQILDDGRRLTLELSQRDVAGARDRGIMIACAPLLPTNAGSSDRRRLGLPIFSIELAGP
jgi:hypothetical protein